ncbi:class I SAM-dependent methyltransferase [Lysinibacillus xylanilyticus]|uniref:class I SAM-dependent methyltransferase n=1 Tax=Lysinibacillus xylanilyticus TaxID=582475 RepID=UPI003D06FCF5
MNKGESSLTSLISAFSRAYHSQFYTPKIFDDYLAKDLITEKGLNDIQTNMVQGIQFFNKEIAEKLNGNTEVLLKWIVQIQLSPTPLARAAYCEKVLLNEVMLGLQQYVILGAGLDTFSFRHPELEHILEIDHPATQQFKKTRLDEAHFKLPSNVHFVAMDFADENLFKEKGLSNRVDNMVKMAAVSGEPMKSCFTYEEMEKMLEKSGLLIYEHLSPSNINQLYFDNREDYLTAFETIHYVHAVKK